MRGSINLIEPPFSLDSTRRSPSDNLSEVEAARATVISPVRRRGGSGRRER
jgi:hypothetical protein